MSELKLVGVKKLKEQSPRCEENSELFDTDHNGGGIGPTPAFRVSADGRHYSLSQAYFYFALEIIVRMVEADKEM